MVNARWTVERQMHAVCALILISEQAGDTS
jgi:hypothetical protein